jgi:DNA-binding MarR family transcriptional regulator
MGSEAALSKTRSVDARGGTGNGKRLRKIAPIATREVSDVQRALELFLFAHLNLAADAEAELTSLGFHRTHHRILYLVASHPGTNVGDLINTLRLTPQAVQSPMRQLNERGYVEQRYATTDRRKRCLFVTSKGTALLAKLSSRQHRRIAEAFHSAGPTAVKGFLAVMGNMLTKEDRHFVEHSLL